jgi:hypothetical protein
MRFLIAALLIVAAIPGAAAFASPIPADPPDLSPAFTPFEYFIDSINAGNVDKAVAQCTANSIVVDEFPPSCGQKMAVPDLRETSSP